MNWRKFFAMLVIEKLLSEAWGLFKENVERGRGVKAFKGIFLVKSFKI
jgi:hypothetical protein